MTAIDTVESPLAQTARRLSGLDADLAYRVGIPDQPGWHRLGDLTDAALLAGWHAELSAREGDRRTAAAYLGGWVASAAVEAYLLPVLAEARLPLAGVDGIGVHRHAEGWLDAIALPEAPFAALPGDPAEDAAGAQVLTDRGALLDATAERLAGVAPVLAAIAASTPVGQAALWGQLADSIGGRSLWLARLLDLHRRAVWTEAQALIDRVAALQPGLRQRPRLFPVVHGGGEEWFQVRGTCCLYYRTAEEADPDGEGYCGTCPLRTDSSRARRLSAHLDDQPAS